MNNLNKEDGYILIVVVGILMVFSLMAITFATLSRVETKATRNYADSVKCETIAKAGLEYAIYVLRRDKFGTDTTAYDSDPPDSYDENYDWSGETWMPGGVDFSGTDCDNDGNGTPESQWINFPADIRLPGNLRARYAVLITDDREARVNINATGNEAGLPTHASNEGWSTFEIDLSDLIQREVGNGPAIANLIIEARHGPDLNPGDDALNDDSAKIPDPQNDGIDNDGDSIIDEPNEVTNEPGEFNSISPIDDDVPFDILAEVEIMGTTTYTSELEGIFTTGGISQDAQGAFKGYLTTYSADTIVCPDYPLDGGTSTTMLNINALINNEGAYTNTGIYTPIKQVQMIIDVLTAGGVPDVERQQLAVNIKDFIDSDGTSTRYVDVVPDPDVTYYGVDKGTPYINEVEAKVSGGGMGKYIELFNPYDTAVNIAGWTIEFGANIITLTGPTIPARDYYVVADDDDEYENVFEYEGVGVFPDQEDSDVNNLSDAGEVIKLKNPSGIEVQVTTYLGTTNANTSQLNDPRPIPLTTGDPSEPWEWAAKNETAGEENYSTIFDPAEGDDGWDDTTWSPSFFIANRRFSNKGYLGFIHRGKEWSSFKVDDNIVYPDVLKYITITDPSMDGIDNDGDFGTDTADTGLQAGDIDGKEHRIPGLINVNTASAEVLQSLPNINPLIATEIINTRNVDEFKSIGDLVDRVDGANGITDTAAADKWDRELRFRSISNLITTRSNVFTVYVTAQVTDEAVPPDTKVFAEKRLMAIVDRSVNPIKVRYFRWITE